MILKGLTLSLEEWENILDLERYGQIEILKYKYLDDKVTSCDIKIISSTLMSRILLNLRLS